MKARLLARCLVVITLAVLLLAWLAYMHFRPASAVADAVGPAGVSFGPQHAPITVVAFVSPVCPHCRNFELESAPMLYRAALAGKVRYVVYPVKTGSATDADMVALLCAAKQNAFASYLTRRFEQPHSLTRLAQWVGLNPRRFSGCLEDNEVSAQATRIAAWAKQLKVQATPTFYVRDTPATPFRKVEGDKGAVFWQALSNRQSQRKGSVGDI